MINIPKSGCVLIQQQVFAVQGLKDSTVNF
jgi:hypothetical protein